MVLRTVGLLVLLVLAALVAAPAGSPVQVSYVYSDSMAPTIGVGDGYILVPAGDVKTGDIVTFWSEQRGAYTTHRVVAETDAGFQTQGDNNEVSDQAGSHPPVTRDAIVGRVLTWQGTPLTIPHLGSVVRFVHEHVIALVGLVALGGLLARGDTDAATDRPPTARATIVPLLLAAMVGTAGIVALGGATHTETVIAVEQSTGTNSVQTIPIGTTSAANYTVTTPARPWTDRVVHTAGLQDVTVGRNSTAMTVSGAIHAPKTAGPIPVKVAVRSYPSVLPRSTIARLDAVDPLLAAAVCTGLTFTPLVVALGLLVDGRARFRTSRSRLWRLLVEGFE